MCADLLTSTASVSKPDKEKRHAKRKLYGDAPPAYGALGAAAPAPAPAADPPPTTMHQQRHGDRGSKDDADGRRLPIYVRYNDLIAANIVRNWPALLRLMNKEGFPVGVLLGRNTRAWQLDEIESWLASRPTAKKIIVLPTKPRNRKTKDIAAAVTA